MKPPSIKTKMVMLQWKGFLLSLIYMGSPQNQHFQHTIFFNLFLELPIWQLSLSLTNATFKRSSNEYFCLFYQTRCHVHKHDTSTQNSFWKSVFERKHFCCSWKRKLVSSRPRHSATVTQPFCRKHCPDDPIQGNIYPKTHNYIH